MSMHRNLCCKKKNNRPFKKTRVYVIGPNREENETKIWKGDEKESRTLHSIVEEFIAKTTIPGLSQLGGSKGAFAKTCWVLLFFTGICMAIYQSRNLIEEYRRYAVIERSSREVQWRIPFPAATVCINYPARWTNYTEEPGLSLVKNSQRSFAEAGNATRKNPMGDYKAEEKIFYDNLLLLSESERAQLSIPLSMFLISCTWGDDNCSENVVPFNNLYYGNCFTFNAGFNQSDPLLASKSESLNVILRSDFDDVFPYMERDDGLSVLIHPPGSAPVLDSRRIYNLYPGRWLKLGVTMTEFNRLEAPYVSKCIDSYADDQSSRSLYNTPDRPYIYTMDACTESCLQNMSIAYCNCVVPYLPIPPNYPNNVCVKEGSCNAMNNKATDLLCGCRKSCKDRIYEIRVDVDDRWLTQAVWVQWVHDALNEFTRTSINMSLVSGFELYVASTLFETIKEEPKISWADFLGSIGGNLGLWVGISVISMVEIVELMSSLVMATVNKIVKCCSIPKL